MRMVKEEVTSLREPADAETEKLWWSIWATHVANDAIITETAQTFAISRSKAWHAIRWCAEQLRDGRATEAVSEAVAYAKRLRLRAVRLQREDCWKTQEHQFAIGYLKEERELENEIAAIEGVATKRSSVALGQDPDLGPVKVEQSGRMELTGDAALAVLTYHENAEPEVDELHPAQADAEAGCLPESE